jgi:SAM-dependent methyltransferase
MSNTLPKGALDTRYSAERYKKPELIFRYKTRARVVARAAKELLKSSGPYNVLDLGAAEGLTLLELSKLIPIQKGLGIELATDLFEFAPPFPDNLSLIEGDVTDLPASAKESTYDIISSLALLEHVPDPLKVVKEACSVLNPGGLFIATCPNPMWDTISTTLGLLRDDQHMSDMGKEQLMNVVTDAGLELVEFKPFMWAPIGFLPYLKVPVGPDFSLDCDDIVRKLKIFNLLFVNQCVIGRKAA